MEFTSIDDVVDFAIEKEREAADFYRSAAGHESAQANKSVFVEYADEEEKHEKMLKEFKADKSAFDNYQFKKIQDIKRADYLMDMEYSPGMSYHEVMRLAMKREEKAYKLYQKMAGSADSDQLKNIFEILANEELKHKSSLEGMYDDIVKETGD